MTLYIDASECISCGDCEPVCPTDSISEGPIVFEINANTCTECEDDYGSPECLRACPIDNCILPLEAKTMSQETLSRELALRIGLAARALPDTDTKRLLYVLTDGNKQFVSEKKISRLKLKQLKSACNGELSSLDDADLEQALSILKGNDNVESIALPEVVAYQEGDMPGSIRIACASNNGFKLDGHFGSCSLFLVYQVSATESRLIDIRLTKIPKDVIVEEKNDYRAELIHDCQVLYIASVGGPAAAKIVKKSIHPIKMPNQDSIDAIVKQLQQVIAGTPPPWLGKTMGISPEQRVRFEQA